MPDGFMWWFLGFGFISVAVSFHTLGKFTNVIDISADLCMVFVNKAAGTFSSFAP